MSTRFHAGGGQFVKEKANAEAPEGAGCSQMPSGVTIVDHSEHAAKFDHDPQLTPSHIHDGTDKEAGWAHGELRSNEAYPHGKATGPHTKKNPY